MVSGYLFSAYTFQTSSTSFQWGFWCACIFHCKSSQLSHARWQNYDPVWERQWDQPLIQETLIICSLVSVTACWEKTSTRIGAMHACMTGSESKYWYRTYIQQDLLFSPTWMLPLQQLVPETLSSQFCALSPVCHMMQVNLLGQLWPDVLDRVFYFHSWLS